MPTASIKYDERLDQYVFPFEDGAISVAREKCWERDGKAFARIQDRVWQFAGPLPLMGAEEAEKEGPEVEATGSAGATLVSQSAAVEETPTPPEAQTDPMWDKSFEDRLNKSGRKKKDAESKPEKRKPGRPRKSLLKD